MADPKRGLSSWLHVAQRTAAAPSAAQQDGASATSPLDISLAILRAKETISRISPDKRVVVEEIDEDPDDAEFDEKAHWGRRAAASRRKKLKTSRDKAADPGYSIKAFCVAQPGASVAPSPASAVAEGVPPAIAQELADLVPESAEEHSEELGTDAAGQQQHAQPRGDGDDDGEQISSLDDPESVESISSSSAGSDDATEPPPSETMTTPEQVTPQQHKQALRTGGSASVVKETPPSGRPKRQAVLRAQEASEVAKRQTPPLVPGSLRRLQSDGLIDLRTPPPPKASKKLKRATSSSSSQSNRLELKTPPIGRKRKLEMDKSTPSPGGKETFFLSEQDRKQLQEIEAIAKLREQVRQTREKDLAFFSGKTAVNPFFTQAPPKPQLKSSSSTESTGASAMDVIEIEAGTPGSQERVRGPRWSKDVVHFPATQHVVCAVVDEPSPVTGGRQRMPPRRAAVGPAPTEIVLLDDDDDDETIGSSSALLRALSQSRDQQVETEATLSDLFWFRQYATPDAVEDSAQALLPSPSFHMRCPFEYESETALIDALVETYGVREKRVREVLDSLVAAKDKRREKAANLTLVDQYAPVIASGIVGNKEPLRLLASWLGAWKLGGGERERKSCFQAELFVFEGDDSDSDDVADLCRLFVLEGDSGAGKSAAVYACADELGYNVIEINAGQNRAGRSIVEIAGEATQSTRVLHIGGGDRAKGKAKGKSSKGPKKRSRKSLDSSAAHLSLVLFEDVDLVFDEDKGFLSSICSIAKHSKCPIVLTCSALPDAFPAAPQRLRQVLTRPSVREFSTWMLLVAHLEVLPLAPAFVETLAQFFRCDIRQALHFVQTYAPQLATKHCAAQWSWRPKTHAEVVAMAAAETVDLVENVENDPITKTVVPAWTHYPARSFDMLASNLLVELAACAQTPEEDKSTAEKVADTYALERLAATLDAVSVADVWTSSVDAENEDAFFDRERTHLMALDVRMAGLAALLAPGELSATELQRRETSSAECVRRSLDAALAQEQRSAHTAMLRAMQDKIELPLAALGAGSATTRFSLDYMPMVSRILNSSASHQTSRRRTSRRNHYLSDVLTDMSLVDELHACTTFAQSAASDQIVAASPSSSPLAS